MGKNIISELFGTEELSDDYLTLLKNYQMTEEDGILIRDETIDFILSLDRYGNYKDYEMILFTIDEFRRNFSMRFEKIHNREINADTLNQYKPNKAYWQIKNNQDKTKQILEPYTGEDFLNEIFLKDLVSYNLLGQYVNICGILLNTPSSEFTDRDVRQFCLLKFKDLNLLDKIEEKHPQSMNDAVRYLIENLSQEDIDVIYASTLDKYGGFEYLFLGVWIRNEFGLNEKINSKLTYECYKSKYNDRKTGKKAPLWMADGASPIILKEL